MNKAIIGVIALVIVGGGAFMLLKKDEPSKPSNTNQVADTTQNPATEVEESEDISVSAATITFSDDGFTPGSVTVKSGDVVTITNSSSSDLDFESDPHPIHTDNGQLNAGTIAAGESKDITVTETGTFGVHNHLDSTQTATIIVE